MIEILGVAFGGALLVFGAVVIFLGIIFAVMYNTLVGKKNQVETSFSTVDVMLKKRYDLIPNLVSSVKTYMIHERELLTKVTELRAEAIKANKLEQKVDLNNRIGGFIRNILIAVENYPDLKANQNFLSLQSSLNEIEEQISAARRSYNASVLDYNNAVQMFPTNIFAKIIGYGREPFFEAQESERQNVDVGKMFRAE
ncbi:MAG TPA: LemA family protein [Candidatus Altiarchaeales archaeon]|nr:LemA family protein [Candidatus Altiarchaeales archaeon]